MWLRYLSQAYTGSSVTPLTSFLYCVELLREICATVGTLLLTPSDALYDMFQRMMDKDYSFLHLIRRYEHCCPCVASYLRALLLRRQSFTDTAFVS